MILSALPDELRSALALASPRLRPFTQRIVWRSSVGSTNDVACALAEQGAAEGVVVVADQQTAGRGRLGRTWVSPAGAGLYLSVVLRPSLRAAALLTVAAGVAVAEGVEAATGLEAQLKWPNDVQIGRRKLAGILAEGASRYLVLGIGINVMPAAYPMEISARATSIEAELGRPVDRGLVLAECLAALAARYRGLNDRGGREVVDAWRRRAAATLGRHVEWEAGGQIRTGLAQDIDEDGALLVRSGAELVRIRSGEVRWV